jgi:tetratricopeptide (TPR) repeat protein
MDTNKKSNNQSDEYEKKASDAHEQRNFLEAAQWYLKAENFEKAAQMFEIEKDYERAAHCYFKNQDYLAAADNYEKASKEELAGEMFELARKFIKAADIAIKYNKYQQAGQLYERAGNYFKAGEAFLLADDHQNALLNLEMLNEPDPDFLNAKAKIAGIFLIMNNPKQVIHSLEEFLKSKEIDRFNIDCFLALGQAYENLRNFKKARALYKRVLVFDSANYQIQQKLIEIRKLIDEAMELGYSERYEKEKEVGRGGMGIVYRARDLKLDRTVALKILKLSNVTDDSDIERFHSEARKAARMKHPNIVTVYDDVKTEKDYFISMEFIEGIDLETIIREKNPIPITDTLMIAKKLFMALNHSHQKGIIHRDIKPKNIMITYDNDVKVVDFGIAVLKEELSKKDRNFIAGTPEYMSPEQSAGRTLDHRTDIYSAGVTLFQLVTGDVPFKGSILEILDKHQHEPIPCIKELRPDAPEGIIRIIEICMAKDPGKRYPGARQVIRDLESLRDSHGNPYIKGKSTLKIFKKTGETNGPLDEKSESTEVNLNPG